MAAYGVYSYGSRETDISLLKGQLKDDSRGRPVCRSCLSLTEAEETTVDTFPLFAELPLELQRRIWHFAALLPRVVEVHEVQFEALEARVCEGPLIPGSDSDITYLRSRTEDPSLLRTCRQSREFALPKYKRTDLAIEYCADSVYFEFQYETMYPSYNTIRAWITDWLPGGQYAYRTQFPPGTRSRRYRGVHSFAFSAGLLIQKSANSTPGHSWMVPNAYACTKLVEKLLRIGSVQEVIIVLNDDHFITNNQRLSSIRFHEPVPGSAVADLLGDVAQLFRKEFGNRVAQDHRTSENLRRNLGGAWTSSMKGPVVRTMVRKLKPVASNAGFGSDRGRASLVAYQAKQKMSASRKCHHNMNVTQSLSRLVRYLR